MANEIDRDLQHLYKVIDKLDTAIEKLSDVSTDIKQILAVHEQRLDSQENIMERHFVQMDAVHNRVSNLRDDMLESEARILERIAVIDKWRWQIMGGAAVIATVITMMGELMHVAG